MASKAAIWQIHVIGVSCFGAGAGMMYLELTTRSSSFGRTAVGAGIAALLKLLR
jgi:hypothetical protein